MPSTPCKILIVDDEPSKQLTMRVILEPLGEQLVSVDSGREALRRLLAEEFAVVLMDVNMPGLDGFETAALIRQRPKTEHLPIIFVTAFYDDARALESYSLGAVDYMMTPVIPEVLRAKVQVFVDLFVLRQEISQQAAARIALAEEQAARIAAENSNKAKSAFLANISHELRTPMNAIIGMTDLALAEQLPPTACDYLATAKSSAYALLGLLNEILDVSRLEAGKFHLEELPFDLLAVVEETLQTLSVRAFEKGLELSWSADPELSSRVIGDPLRVQQILMNLLGNAVKFTAEGEIGVRLQQLAQTPETVTIRCSVSDTGIGVAAEDQTRIFEAFTQADASLTRNYGGTGLGLAIAADLVQMMQGQLRVVSVVGRGSRFSFDLQFPRQPLAPAEPGPAPFAWPDAAVPFLDAAPWHRQAVLGMLQELGLRAQAVSLEDLEGRDPLGRPVPLLIVSGRPGDAELPRWLEKLAAGVYADRMLLLLAPAERQRLRRLLESRPDIRCVEKPVSPRLLRQALSAWTTNPGAAPPPREETVTTPPVPAARASRPLRILLAEDTPANQKLLLTVLTRRGHEVHLAADGREAVEQARQHAFDVILMDVQMPHMDGLEATRRIRGLAAAQGPQVPIIAMTAHAMTGDRERFLDAGMDDYVPKPIHLPQLLTLLESRYSAPGPLAGEVSPCP
ncbi:hybrid sensor histidine kinase/response regulator [Planctomicrobium piriforme]|uniref:histidine kinase n=1 Tax=Planctomicrobium piriforme TaxID=1576369 RepID=A0A1I3RXX2_9PLAN|nr:hybrid sensor histidine kinase/response regulator [Planctomicrobium piriforme]SFJ51188.1 Signal transduction histidine kinase [Planctomicrobium piriforme]